MRKTINIIIPLLIIAIPIVATISWFSSLLSRPTWQMSARNSPQGVVVEVYKSNSSQPTYKTVLKGKTISTEVERATRTELPSTLGQTTFHDESLRPGRWTVMLQETEIDIMERALILDGNKEVAPKD